MREKRTSAGKKKTGHFLALLLVPAVLAGALCACVSFEGNTDPPVKIITATDIHYLSPKLMDGGKAFRAIVETGDGKVLPYIDKITEAFVTEVLEQKPDLLLLTGDLTFNGEYQSHKDLIAKFKRLRDAGIAVLVLVKLCRIFPALL